MKAIFEPFVSAKPFIFHRDVLKRVVQSANWHEALEVLYCAEGSGFVVCNNNHHEVTAGDIIIVNSNYVHYTASNAEMILYCLIINKNFCLANNVDLNALRYTERIHDNQTIALFETIIQESKNTDVYHKFSTTAAVQMLLFFLTRQYSSPISTLVKKNNSNDTSVKRIYTVIQYIEDHLEQKITSEELASIVHLSKYHLLHEFKRVTNLTVSEIINILRCERAKEMLSNENDTASEIARKCGFDNYAYFSNVFKKNSGISPTEYRHLYCQK